MAGRETRLAGWARLARPVASAPVRLVARLALPWAAAGLLGCQDAVAPKVRLPVEAAGEPVAIRYPSAAPRHQRPGWVRDAVVYELKVSTFTPEGTFRAVIPQLDRIRRLGVTIIWLMPIHPVGIKPSNGGVGGSYCIRDYYSVHPALGDAADLRALVAAIHERGMRVILDLAINHTSWDHPWLTEHPDWYERNQAGEITYPLNSPWRDVADLDNDHPEVQAELTEVMRHWVREFDIDGYRADVAYRIPGAFWETAIAEVRKLKPVIMLAEAESPDLHDRGFDLSYSWELYTALKAVWAGAPAGRLVEVLRAERQRFPEHALHLRFTTNHDLVDQDGAPARLFASAAGARAAFLFMSVAPGVPLVYRGQELDLADRWNGRPQPGSPTEAFYVRVFELLEQHPALRYGDLLVHNPDARDALILERQTGDERLLIIINLRVGLISVQLPEAWRGRALFDLLGGSQLPPGPAAELGGYEARVLVAAD